MYQRLKFPCFDEELINTELEKKMHTIQEIVSTIHSLRKNNNIKIRQPLKKIVLYSLDDIRFIHDFKNIILNETNIKELEIVEKHEDFFDYNVKSNFEILRKKYNNLIKDIADEINKFGKNQIDEILKNNKILLKCGIELKKEECIFKTIPKKNNCIGENENITIILDTNITNDLKMECIARDFIKLVQDYRKNNEFKIDDRIEIFIKCSDIEIKEAIEKHANMICKILLCNVLKFVEDKEDMKPFIIDKKNFFLKVCIS